MHWTLSVLCCHALSLVAGCWQQPVLEGCSLGIILPWCHMVSFQPCQAMPTVTLHSCVTEYASSTWTMCHLAPFSRFQLVIEQCWVSTAEGKMNHIGLFEIWKKLPFFPALIPVAISGVLSCLFVHYLCIIRQTIIPLCFASVVQMLTGNESPQRPVKE